MKLGIFTDPHYCNKELTCGTRSSLMSYEKIKQAMDGFIKEDVAAVICLGDFLDDCGSYEGNVTYAKKLTQLILNYGLPFYCLMGNHDHLDFTRKDFAAITKSVPPFCVEMGDSILIFLDCNHHDDGEPYSPKRADWTNSFLPQEQLENLENVLSCNKDKKAYIFSHQPIGGELAQNHIVRNAPDIRRVINAAGNVKGMYSGHFHGGFKGKVDGIDYVTVPAMCEGEKNSFIIVDI